MRKGAEEHGRVPEIASRGGTLVAARADIPVAA